MNSKALTNISRANARRFNRHPPLLDAVTTVAPKQKRRYHDEWCDLNNGGIECSCTYYDNRDDSAEISDCDWEYK